MTQVQHTNGIAEHHAHRLPAITGAILKHGRARAVDTALTLSRRGAMRAAAERCNAAINRLIELLYEMDDTGLRANVDATGRILIPVPWGDSYLRYGLRATEADVLALHVHRLAAVGNVPPLLVYDVQIRRWLLNADYPTMAAAVAYWRRCELGAGDYLALAEEIRNQSGNGRG